jgi:hypothetical protein
MTIFAKYVRRDCPLCKYLKYNGSYDPLFYAFSIGLSWYQLIYCRWFFSLLISEGSACHHGPLFGTAGTRTVCCQDGLNRVLGNFCRILICQIASEAPEFRLNIKKKSEWRNCVPLNISKIGIFFRSPAPRPVRVAAVPFIFWYLIKIVCLIPLMLFTDLC